MKNSTNKVKPPKKARPTYRKDIKPPSNYVLCLYGRLVPIGKVNAYCNFHKCYLQAKDIKEKKCKRKKCKQFKKLGKYRDIEE